MANRTSAARLGVVSGGRRSEAALRSLKHAAATQPALLASAPATAPATAETVQKDYFVERNGVRFAGTHLLLELWDASGLDDIALAEQALRDATTAAGATLLHIHLHHFSPNGGYSGVAVLAESHISIHTWPEFGFAAVDAFMCGDCRPQLAVDIIRSALQPASFQLKEELRGPSHPAAFSARLPRS